MIADLSVKKNPHKQTNKNPNRTKQPLLCALYLEKNGIILCSPILSKATYPYQESLTYGTSFYSWVLFHQQYKEDDTGSAFCHYDKHLS